MSVAASDFRTAAESEAKQRLAICVYLRRGLTAGFAQSELIDFLGVSSPSILDMAGYSDDAAQHVMELLAGIRDEEIQGP